METPLGHVLAVEIITIIIIMVAVAVKQQHKQPQ
jgi:hypothetical protein